MRQASNRTKLILALGVGVAVFAFCVYGLGWQVLLALLPALLAFLGTFFVFRPRSRAETEWRNNDAEFRRLLKRAHRDLRALQALAVLPAAGAAFDLLDDITARAEGIVDGLAGARQHRLPHIHSIESTLSVTREVMEQYLALESGRLSAIPSRRDPLLAQVTAEFLPAILASLIEFSRRLDEEQVLDLETSIRSTLLRLNIEGL